MSYKLTTLDKNILSQLWRNRGQCQLSELKAAAPDLPEVSFIEYMYRFARRSRAISFIDLPVRSRPSMDTFAQMDPEFYASWWA